MIVIFVNGCFWHGHKGCPHFRIPKTRTEWWTEKIGKTQKRDQRSSRKLRALGWKVITIWECRLKSAAKLERLEKSLLESIGG